MRRIIHSVEEEATKAWGATMSSFVFLKKFIGNPKQIGSITPSSRYLAQEMTRVVPWDRIRSVAELGSGTGAVTQYIESRLAHPAKVFLFEKDQQLRQELSRQYPEFICGSDALQMSRLIRHYGVDQLDCIISGLPFFNFDPKLRARLAGEIAKNLKSGGYLVAFQYSLQMKPVFESLFEMERIKFVPLNIPPAFVYVCRKR